MDDRTRPGSAAPAPRPVSLGFALFEYWRTVPPGTGVTMDEMVEAAAAPDAHRVRMALTQLRQGLVPNPAVRGAKLPKLPVRYNALDAKYYDFSKMGRDAIAHQVPGYALAKAVGEMVTRVATLESAMGSDGLEKSALLLEDPEMRDLIRQLPLPQLWQLHDTVLTVAKARQLLAMGESVGAIAPTRRGEET